MKIQLSFSFFYRLKSLEPFVRHFSGQQLLDTFAILNDHSDEPTIQGEFLIINYNVAKSTQMYTFQFAK